MMKKPYIPYFRGTIAEKVAQSLSFPHVSIPISSSKSSIEAAVTQLKVIKPSLVIALGSYSGRDKEKLRIELLCNKKWRNIELKQFPIINIKTVLHETKMSKFAYKHGNSWCNLLSLNCVNTLELSNVYNFIHIPNTFHVKLAAEEIFQQIKSL